jgi:plasmid stabilization system protein ParE
MIAKKIISSFAKNDLSETSKWYEKQQKGLGKRFLKEVKATIDIISKNPKGFPIRYDECRICYTTIFPFGIHYKYIANKNEIHIKAVFHTARNPQIWQQRVF